MSQELVGQLNKNLRLGYSVMTLHRKFYLLVIEFHLVIKDIAGLKVGIGFTGLLSDLVLKD